MFPRGRDQRSFELTYSISLTCLWYPHKRARGRFESAWPRLGFVLMSETFRDPPRLQLRAVHRSSKQSNRGEDQTDVLFEQSDGRDLTNRAT